MQTVIAVVVLVVSAPHLGAQPSFIGKSKEPIKGATLGARVNDMRAGRFLIDPPTLENLGFRWYVEGDSNRNAKVEVAFRRKGDVEWKDALPMLRVHYEIVNQDYGQGHVVCYNRITRFSDSLAIANFGPPVADVERHCVAIDFYNNDLSWAQDDTIEADYGCHNVRVYRNRCYNTHTALSTQPFYRGPVYLILVQAGPPEEGKTYQPPDFDLRLRRDAKCVDAGLALPQITDGFYGTQPDLGCYELGQATPHYGPRR